MLPISEIKVTKINCWYHARLFVNGKLYDESACELRQDIGFICRDLLRWFDKMGGNKHSHASRHRQKVYNKPAGKIKRNLLNV